ncbi:RHS repeat protein, partial [Ammonifex thiophilus]
DGRLKSIAFPEGTVNFGYDEAGRLVSVAEGGRTSSYGYDGLGRLVRYTDPRGYTLTYEYDLADRLRVMTYPDGRKVLYDYYPDGRLKSVTDWAGRTTTYEYYPNGLLKKITRPNGTVAEYEYDPAGKVVHLKDCDRQGRVIVEFTYAYSPEGNVVEEKSSVREVPLKLPDAEMTYGPDNRLESFSGQRVEHDADGNLVLGPLGGRPAEFRFDSRNRLVKAGETEYFYDPEGRRIALVHQGKRIDYLIDPSSPLFRVVAQVEGDRWTCYVWGLGLVEEERDGKALFYHYDLRGSTVALTDEKG